MELIINEQKIEDKFYFKVSMKLTLPLEINNLKVPADKGFELFAERSGCCPTENKAEKLLSRNWNNIYAMMVGLCPTLDEILPKKSVAKGEENVK